MKTRVNNMERGFSLVEVLIAMAVFAVTALGLAALNKVAMDATVSGRERTAAANIAQYSMTWLHNEIGSYSQEDNPLTSISGAYFPLISTSPASTGWQLLTGGVRLDEYLDSTADTTKYGTVDTAKYCVHYRVLSTNGFGSTKVLPENLFHVSVLVTWPKEGQYSSDWKDCSARVNSSAAQNYSVPDAYHSVYLQQVLTRDFSNKITLPTP